MRQNLTTACYWREFAPIRVKFAGKQARRTRAKPQENSKELAKKLQKKRQNQVSLPVSDELKAFQEEA